MPLRRFVPPVLACLVTVVVASTIQADSPKSDKQQAHKTLAERGLTLEVEPEARDRLARLGYDPAFGARPLKRVLAKRLLDPLALGLLDGRFSDGDRVIARLVDDEISLENAGQAAFSAA